MSDYILRVTNGVPSVVGPITPTPIPPPVPTPPPIPVPPPAPGPVPLANYPSDTTTGVPKGTVLTRVPQDITSGQGWHWDSRGWLQVDQPGALLDKLDVTGAVDIAYTAKNTLVKNCRVTADGFASMIIRADNAGKATGVVIQDTEVRGGPNGSGVCIGSQWGIPVTIQRCNLHNTSTAVQLDRGQLLDSYLWDLHVVPDGTHVNGVTSNAGSGAPGLTIRHNTILNAIGQTDAVSLFQDFGIQADVTIDNNLLAGGGYTIYGGQGDKGPTKNIRITNNRISTVFFPKGGQFGWLAHFTATDSGNVLSGNVWHETGLPVG